MPPIHRANEQNTHNIVNWNQNHVVRHVNKNMRKPIIPPLPKIPTNICEVTKAKNQ